MYDDSQKNDEFCNRVSSEKEKITSLLISLGVSTKRKGFLSLYDSIYYCFNKIDEEEQIVLKDIYTIIENKEHHNRNAIKRNIHTCVLEAVTKGNLDNFYKVFGDDGTNDDYFYTDKSFIIKCAYYLKFYTNK